MTWYQDAEIELSRVATAVQGQQPMRLEKLHELAERLVVSLKRSDELVVAALSNPPGSPLVTNLIHVAILATKVGIGLGYYGKELERLALGGLLHDIGIFAVPQSLTTKPGRLTPEERRIVEQHPELGSAVILGAGPDYRWLSQLVRHAHERSNGQGYPSGLRGRQISEMAQIIGVVDVFDALVSARPYRSRMLPHEAIKEILVAERTTFPREIVKALVEQLSVYPLGTIIRLSTGEVGTVARVNPHYPLRPVVRIDDRESPGGQGGRQIDLSLTPLVTIVDIIEAPAVGRIAFTAQAEPTSPGDGAQDVTDRFAAILESLDTIAGAIQGVVNARKEASRASVHGGWREGESGHDPAAAGFDPAYQREVIGLFALEAREWLGQVQAALRRLAGRAEGPVRAKLYGVILNGITNLARSAATVHLAEIEAMASGVLPLLHKVGGAEGVAQPDTIDPLRRGIQRLAGMVNQLDDSGQASTTEADQVKESPEAAEADASGHETVAFAPPGLLLSALHELQRARARSVQPARDVLEAIIQRAEQEADRESAAIDAAVIGRILRDLDRLDDEFLREIHDRVPAMIDLVTKLRAEGSVDFITASQLDPIFGLIESLHDSAKTVQATTIMMFLQGIKSFLNATAYRKLANLTQRLEAVDARIQTLVPMAEQWVHLGRLERAAIEEILPA